MDIESLLKQRSKLRKDLLYSVGHVQSRVIEKEIEELDKLIPWSHYIIKNANVEMRRDGYHWDFQHIRSDLADKPLTDWTEEELDNILPYSIEDVDMASIEKVD